MFGYISLEGREERGREEERISYRREREELAKNDCYRWIAGGRAEGMDIWQWKGKDRKEHLADESRNRSIPLRSA